MFDELKTFCKKTVSVLPEELELIDKYFEKRELNKKEYLLQDGSICNFLGFIAQGSIRHFHVKDGVEKTCDISFENSWVTDFHSFTNGTPCLMNLQAIEECRIYTIQKKNLEKLYGDCAIYETFGQLMIERITHHATEMVMSLTSEKPEERFENLIKSQPEILQRVPQKYIANVLGISPESLSRIRNRIIKKHKS